MKKYAVVREVEDVVEFYSLWDADVYEVQPNGKHKCVAYGRFWSRKDAEQFVKEHGLKTFEVEEA